MSPGSSSRVRTTSTGMDGVPSSRIEVRVSRMIAKPALSSPPPMVVPSEAMRSPSTMGLMPLPGDTVSR